MKKHMYMGIVICSSWCENANILSETGYRTEESERQSVNNVMCLMEAYGADRIRALKHMPGTDTDFGLVSALDEKIRTEFALRHKTQRDFKRLCTMLRAKHRVEQKNPLSSFVPLHRCAIKMPQTLNAEAS